MPGVHDFALFVASGILLNLTPGADTLYIVTRAATPGTQSRRRSGAGHRRGLLRAHRRRGTGPVRAAGDVGRRVHRGQAGRRGLPDLHGSDAVANRPSFAEACHRADAGDVASAHFRAGRADQYPESEGRAVLSGVPAAVRRSGGDAPAGRIPRCSARCSIRRGCCGTCSSRGRLRGSAGASTASRRACTRCIESPVPCSWRSASSWRLPHARPASRASSRRRLAFDRRRCALGGGVGFGLFQLALALFFLLFLLFQFLLPFLVLIVGFCQG